MRYLTSIRFGRTRSTSNKNQLSVELSLVTRSSTCFGDKNQLSVVGDGIGGAGSLHGRGELGRTGLHKHASIAMVSTISGWPPVSGHPAMVVAIEMQFGRAQERSAWKGIVKGACLLCLCQNLGTSSRPQYKQ